MDINLGKKSILFDRTKRYDNKEKGVHDVLLI